jgi:hypothetical protein
MNNKIAGEHYCYYYIDDISVIAEDQNNDFSNQ